MQILRVQEIDMILKSSLASFSWPPLTLYTYNRLKGQQHHNNIDQQSLHIDLKSKTTTYKPSDSQEDV
jgi:hypothetical protein